MLKGFYCFDLNTAYLSICSLFASHIIIPILSTVIYIAGFPDTVEPYFEPQITGYVSAVQFVTSDMLLWYTFVQSTSQLGVTSFPAPTSDFYYISIHDYCPKDGKEKTEVKGEKIIEMRQALWNADTHSKLCCGNKIKNCDICADIFHFFYHLIN